MTPLCTLRRALSDPKLLGNALAGDSWQAWRVVLMAAMGEALSDDERVIFKRLTGREREPGARVDELAAVVGRRGGKSRALATLAVYVAALCRHQLAPGERGIVLLLAQNSRAARIILDYAEACFDAVPALAALVVSRGGDCIQLNTGVQLEVRWQSFRAVRGFTLCAAICDEAAFWWSDDSCANPDVETLAALRPGLLTTQGPLVLASSPYARRGVLWDYYRAHFGAAGSPATLVVQGATRDLNPTVPQAWIDAELERDPARNRAEYLAEFRTDVESLVTREAVEACVALDVRERAPMQAVRYFGFIDPSGGSADSMTLAVGHRESDVVVIDALRERKPPFSPEDVVSEFAELLKSYRVAKVTGDRYAGEWPAERFKVHGVSYEPSAKAKSDLYRDLLPSINSRKLELIDNARLVQQLVGLERRTARGGRDSIDHTPGAHDDLANAVAGLAAVVKRGSYDSSLDWVSGPDPDKEFQERRFNQHVLRTGGYYGRLWR